MDVVAIIHTEGVILFNKYVILELAYADILGVHRNFFIQSPMCYKAAKKQNKYLHMSQEVIMCTSSMYHGQRVYKYREIVYFLKHRYRFFYNYFKGNIKFGYKGKSFQENILRQSYIPCINIEIFGIPAIKMLMKWFPKIKKSCLNHKYKNNKCAKHILHLIKLHIFKTRNPFFRVWFHLIKGRPPLNLKTR